LELSPPIREISALPGEEASWIALSKKSWSVIALKAIML
jgi:hypothetical protein